MSGIEYFYAAYSAFAYLGSARFMAVAEAAGREIVHKPVQLDPIVAAAGQPPFTGRTPRHRGYYFGREIERWAEYRDVPMLKRIPTYHRQPTRLANGMLLAGLAQGLNIDRLAHALLRAHWVDDGNLNDRDTLDRVGAAAGYDPGPLLDAALSDPVQAQLDANTEEAIARGVMGSPTYGVDGDLFYGQDHLELVERALERPFADTWHHPAAKAATGSD